MQICNFTSLPRRLSPQSERIKAQQAQTQVPISQCGPGTARVGSTELTGFLWGQHCLPRLAAEATENLNLAAGLGR